MADMPAPADLQALATTVYLRRWYDARFDGSIGIGLTVHIQLIWPFLSKSKLPPRFQISIRQ